MQFKETEILAFCGPPGSNRSSALKIKTWRHRQVAEMKRSGIENDQAINPRWCFSASKLHQFITQFPVLLDEFRIHREAPSSAITDGNPDKVIGVCRPVKRHPST